MADSKKLKQAMQALAEAGYVVKKAAPPTVRKTFEVDVEVLERFLAARKARGLKMKEAITEALELWVAKKS